VVGDRGNVQIVQRDEDVPVNLYTHWAGTELPWLLRQALAKKWRWDDADYLARIIFDTMTYGDHGSETGYGIGTSPGDGEDRILKVVVGRQVVVHMRTGREWTFEQFSQMEEGAVLKVWDGRA
jgi:hypothetical protein